MACDLEKYLVGRTINLDLPETGAAGPAQVVSIGTCPAIESADGDRDRHVVTGSFRHSAGNVIDLQIDGESDSIGVTDNHPFWSENRQAFVAAGSLRISEDLRRADGLVKQVTRLTPRRGPPSEVFNLEIDAQHVYYVGASGRLCLKSNQNQPVASARAPS